MNEIHEKILRWQIKAEIFLKEDRRVFIIDSNNTYFFCDILIVGEDSIYFKPFKGNENGNKIKRYWADIVKFEEYCEVNL